MISVRVYSEADGSDVVIQRSGDEIISLEFETILPAAPLICLRTLMTSS